MEKLEEKKLFLKKREQRTNVNVIRQLVTFIRNWHIVTL